MQGTCASLTRSSPADNQVVHAQRAGHLRAPIKAGVDCGVRPPPPCSTGMITQECLATSRGSLLLGTIGLPLDSAHCLLQLHQVANGPSCGGASQHSRGTGMQEVKAPRSPGCGDQRGAEVRCRKHY